MLRLVRVRTKANQWSRDRRLPAACDAVKVAELRLCDDHRGPRAYEMVWMCSRFRVDYEGNVAMMVGRFGSSYRQVCLDGVRGLKCSM